MPTRAHSPLLLLSFLLTAWSVTSAQQTTPAPTPKPQDDVVRVYTELVQTDVMVFDKQGKFVNGLAANDFELRVDGKPRPIQAFEQITAGSDEESQLAAARGANTINLKRPVPLDRGRIVFFYIDDFHMDLQGVLAAKKVINHFIDKEMGQNDQAAIASATGQIGFLQQLTAERMILRLALDRLTSRDYSVRDPDRPAMGEYEALLIDRLDRDVFDFFVTETIRLNPGMSRDQAAAIVRGRAEATMTQYARLSQNTLLGLERLVQTAKNLPGRKVLFFLSGGFLIENRRGDSISKLRDITNAAAKSGVVIYSMDTRGLVASLQDAATERPFDPFGRLTLSSQEELGATQDGMNALAVDTGGKAIFNTNDLKQGLAPAIKETSTYYLLAWKPDAEVQKQGRFRNLEVKLIGRPNLLVRVRKGYFDLDPAPPAAVAKASPTPSQTKTAPARLRESLLAPYPERSLPILISADYYDVADKGPMLSTAIQVPGEFLIFGQQPDGKIQAVLDLSAVYLDDKGALKNSFLERIVTTAPDLETAKTYRNDITFTYPTKLPPGLYQVRVAARDDQSGKVGSAHAWIEIPDLANKKLTMSTLLLGERTQAMMTNVSSNTGGVNPVALSGSHRFRRESTLRFLIFAYNATFATTDQKPDVAVQVQVIRDDQPVITTALRKVNTEGVTDLARLPYAAEIPLGELVPGRYLLKVTVIDRVSKQSTSRETYFDVY
jgi:VWFA-related protein